MKISEKTPTKKTNIAPIKKNGFSPLYFSFGSFLYILFKIKSSHNRKGIRMSEDYVFTNLMKLFDKNYCKNCIGNKGALSQFKNCKTNGAKNYPINSKFLVGNFIEKYERTDHILLNDINVFIEENVTIDNDLRKWFMSAVIEIVELDTYDNNLFELRKELSKKSTTISMVILLCLYYLVKFRNNNELGIDLLKKFVCKSNNGFKINDKFGYKHIKSIENKQVAISDIKELCETTKTEEAIDNEKLSDYFKYLTNKYSICKNLLFDVPRKFKDIYVCNNISYKKNYNGDIKQRTITNINISDVAQDINYAIIKAPGGYGKSMMLRHILFSAIDDYKSVGLIPVFIQLRDYDKPIIDIIKELNISYFNDIDINKSLKNGSYILLCDGLDETNTDLRMKFEKDLNDFIDRFPNNAILITSRPYDNYSNFEKFITYNLEAFTTEQATECISKLPASNKEKQIEFIENIKIGKFDSEYIKNPLLLSLLYATFINNNITNMTEYELYDESYDILSKRNDDLKQNFNRNYHCGCSPNKFKLMFSEFCYYALIDYKFSFTKTELESYYNKVKCTMASIDDFIYDITISTNIMSLNDGKYEFIHRTFEEYLCLYFILSHKDTEILNLLMPMNTIKLLKDYKNIFNLLNEMDSTRFKNAIIKPYLKNLISECDYHKFLQRIYPHICYDIGLVEYETYTEPNEYLYTLIDKIYKFHKYINNYDIPYHSDFEITNYYVTNDEQLKIIEKDEDYNGCNMDIDLTELFDNSDKYASIINAIDRDVFPLKKEYVKVCEASKTL